MFQVKSRRGRRIDNWHNASSDYVKDLLIAYFNPQEALSRYFNMLESAGAIVETKDYWIRHMEENDD